MTEYIQGQERAYQEFQSPPMIQQFWCSGHIVSWMWIHGNSQPRKPSQEKLISIETRMCEHYGNCFTSTVFCFSHFTRQIDGLGTQRRNERCSRDLMVFVSPCHCDCIETHEYNVAGALILAYFPLSPLPVLGNNVFISPIDARASPASCNFI